MASSSAAAEDATIDIKVLFQSSGTDQQHTFPDLPSSTSVGNLKSKLTETLSHHPSSHHQRLIYRGKLLARDDEILGELFDSASAQPHILHLVVREPPSARPLEPRQPSGPQPMAQPQPLAPPNAPIIQQTRPSTLGTGAVPPPPPLLPVPPQSAPPVQPQTPFDALNVGGPGVAGIPPHLVFQHHMQALRAMPHLQMGNPFAAAQMAMVDPRTAAAVHYGQPMQPQMGLHQPQRDALPNSQSAQSMHTPRAGRSPQRQATNSDQAGPPGLAAQQIPPNNIAFAVPTAHHDINSHVVSNGIRNGQNGEFSITYSTGGPSPHVPGPHNGIPPFAAHLGGRQTPAPAAPSSQIQDTRSTRSMPNWPNMPPLGTTQEFYGTAHAIDSMQMYRDDLARLQDRLNDHSSSGSPQPSMSNLTAGFRVQAQGILRLRNRAQQMINDLLLPGRYPYHNGLGADDVSRLQSMNSEFVSNYNVLLETLQRIEAPDSSPTPPEPTRTTQHSSPGRINASRSTSTLSSQSPVTAYLLNSPNGPQAMVFNSSGIFNSTGSRSAENTASSSDSTGLHDPVIDQIASLARNRRFPRSSQERMDDRVARARDAVHALNRELASANEALTAANSAVNNLHNTNAEHARSARRAHGPDAAAQPRPQQQAGPVDRQNLGQDLARQEENNVQDLGNILFHTFWHLWTVVKVFAFIWLFTRGMSTRRTVILILASALYLAAQAGLFGDQWDRIRRHFENLIGLPNADRAGPPAERAVQGAAPDGPHPTPDPQTLADRLMQERRARDRNWLTERLVPVERAIALFVASLYPGVGERHIQAREQQRAEQQRQREEAERVQGGAVTEEQAQIGSEPSVPASASVNGSSTERPDAHVTDAGEGSSSGVQASEATETLRERNTHSQAATPSN